MKATDSRSILEDQLGLTVNSAIASSEPLSNTVFLDADVSIVGVHISTTETLAVVLGATPELGFPFSSSHLSVNSNLAVSTVGVAAAST